MKAPTAESAPKSSQTANKTPTLLRDNLRYGTLCGITGVPIMMLSIGGVVLAALCSEMYSFSTSTYGLIVSLPLWFNFLQVLITPFLAQRWEIRRLCLIAAWVHFGGFALLTAALPFIPREETPITLTVFIISFSVISAAMAVSGVTWNAWMQDVIPTRLRGKYLGRRNQLVQASTIVFMLFISGVAALLEGSLLAYMLLFGSALVSRAFSLIAVHRMSTAPSLQAEVLQKSNQTLGLAQQLKILYVSPGVVRFIMFSSLMGFSLSLFGPFQPLFMYEELGLSVARANWIFLFGALGGIASMAVWGRLLDRHGNIPVIIVSLILGQFFSLLWCIIDTSNVWLLYVTVALSSAFGAGYGLGIFALMLKLMPPKVRAMGMALLTSISSLAAAIAPPLGGYLISWAKEKGFDPLSIYHTAFLVSPVLNLLACFILHGIREVQAARVGEVVSAMRNVRTFAALLGLSFFMDQVFYRKGGRRRPGQPRLTRLFD